MAESSSSAAVAVTIERSVDRISHRSEGVVSHVINVDEAAVSVDRSADLDPEWVQSMKIKLKDDP